MLKEEQSVHNQQQQLQRSQSFSSSRRYESQKQQQHNQDSYYRSYDGDIPRPPPITISNSPRRMRSGSQSVHSSPSRRQQQSSEQPIRREGSRSPNRQIYESRFTHGSASASVVGGSMKYTNNQRDETSQLRRSRSREETVSRREDHRLRSGRDYEQQREVVREGDGEEGEEEDESFYGNSTIGTIPTPTNRSMMSRGRSRDRIQPTTTNTSVKSSGYHHNQQLYNSNASSSRYSVVDRHDESDYLASASRREKSPDYQQDLQYIRRSVDMMEHPQSGVYTTASSSSRPSSPNRRVNTASASASSKYPPISSQYPPLPAHLLDTTNPLMHSSTSSQYQNHSISSSVNNLFANTFTSTTTNLAASNSTAGGNIGVSTNTNPLYAGSSNLSLLPRVEELLVVKKDLEDRLATAEMKYKILQEQIQSMPASINIAQVNTNKQRYCWFCKTVDLE